MDSTTILIIAPLVIIQLAIQLYALYDIYQHKGGREPLGWWWVLVVLLASLLGSLIYFAVGRKEENST